MDKQMKLISLSEIELQEVEWLWYPYIPFGKITIIQGDPGEGKTTLGLRLAAACSNGHGFPGMEERAPISVIYQTAEDGLGDTVKPRLMEAEANENLIFNISEDTDVLTLKDKRIEAAIKATGAKLMIFDPIQGYVGFGRSPIAPKKRHEDCNIAECLCRKVVDCNLQEDHTQCHLHCCIVETGGWGYRHWVTVASFAFVGQTDGNAG